ncbi:MAG: hypothetical protein ACP5KE_07260 [Candidatus Methanodesulfokora sp.]
MPPIVLEMRSKSDWRDMVIRFAEELKKAFGERLIRVIALPSPDDEVYDSNVLVVIDRPDQEDRMAVIKIAVKTGDKLNPLVAGEEEEDAIRAFLAMPSRADWNNEHMRFAEELKKAFGERLIRVIALPSPDDEVYDSNVLVVIDRPDQEDRMAVIKIAVKTGDKLNPLVAGEEEEDAIRAFLAAGGRDVEAGESRSPN